MKINLWIDDDREEPKGWLRATNCPNAIKIIDMYGPMLNAISFDHDIGMKGNGADVAKFVKKCALERQSLNPAILLNVHSGNPQGARDIVGILSEIYDTWGKDLLTNLTMYCARNMWGGWVMYEKPDAKGAARIGWIKSPPPKLYTEGLQTPTDFIPTMP